MDLINEEKVNILKKAFGEYIGYVPQIIFFCPNCHHYKKKLSINIDEEIGKCWVCKIHGTVTYLLKKYSSENIQNQWKKVSNNKFSNINIDDESFLNYIHTKLNFNDAINDIKNDPVKWRSEFKKITKISESICNKNALQFLLNRGITYNKILQYNIHYTETGKYSQRIILPSYDENGQLNYFIGRSFFKDTYKYKNPKAEKEAIIFNDLFISWNHEISLVEGPFDAIRNDINAIPILGSTLSEKHVLFEKIVKNKPSINLIFDFDDVGKKALIDTGKLLLQWGIETYYTDISPFKDPGEMIYKDINNAIKNKKLLTESVLMRKVLE